MTMDALVYRFTQRLATPILRDEQEWALDDVASANLLPSAGGGQADQAITDALNESLETISPYTSGIMGGAGASGLGPEVTELSALSDSLE